MADDDAPFFVIGVATRTTNADESGPATARLPRLWQRAYSDPSLAALRAEHGDELIAVLTDYESDDVGAYTQVIGVRVPSVTSLPERLVAVFVPAHPRLGIPAHGAMPDALIAAWQHVWQQTSTGGITRAYATDYERHTADGTEIFLSVTG